MHPGRIQLQQKSLIMIYFLLFIVVPLLSLSSVDIYLYIVEGHE